MSSRYGTTGETKAAQGTGLVDALDRAVTLGKELAGIRRIEHEGHGAGVPVMLVPEGQTVQDLTPMVPALPDRVRAKVLMVDVESFVAYVKEHKTETTRIFAQTTEIAGTFTAAIDYHACHGDPSWVTHLVVLNLTPTPEWETWAGKDGHEFGQVEFAEFLEDNLVDIETPDGATMLEMAKTLEITEGVSFSSKIRLADGSMAFAFSNDVSANAGTDGRLTIPEAFVLRLAPFEGMPAVRIEARFKHRLRRPHLALFYQIVRRRKLVKQMVQAAADVIREETEAPLFHGAFMSQG